MKSLRHLISLISLIIFLVSCSTSYESNNMETEYVEHVFAVQLLEDSSMIGQYLEYHENIWPEVETGFRKAGYGNIRLYRFENFVTMIVQVPEGSDLGLMGQISNDSHPRAAEWNRLMEGFQKGLPGTIDGQTWVELKKFYEFEP